MKRLMTYLEQTSEGEIINIAELEELLAECWDEFTGDYGGMEPQKLLGRMEDVLWRPPILGFVIERHGGTVMGSSRAELQHWTVDVEHKTVTMDVEGYRQIIPRAAILDVNPIAEEIVQLVLKRAKDDRLKWSRKGHVQVLIGKILPEFSAYKRTLVVRRSRLSSAISKNLIAHGWREISHSWYAPDAVAQGPD